jgi:hypothetical protein
MVHLRGRREGSIKSGGDHMSKYNAILHDVAPFSKKS